MIRLNDFLKINRYTKTSIMDIENHKDLTGLTLVFNDYEVKDFLVDSVNNMIYIGVAKIAKTNGKIISGVFVE